MTSATLSRKEKLHRCGVRLEVFTITWNVIEAFVAIGVGLLVGSVQVTLQRSQHIAIGCHSIP